jgi:site-specific DNA-methyltransferase (adenine-specific)
MKKTKLMLGNNIESLKKLPDNSIDSVVTDGPYGLKFMNRRWDYDVPSVEFWKEVYRVLKPGGHVLSFGGTRTYHRMTVNIEDAGFEIRDQIMWLYGSGFPKSLNIGKAVDKLQGNDREVVGLKTDGAYSPGTKNKGIGEIDKLGGKERESRGDDFGQITKGQSPYEGWGTALKPANEPICVARKPISEKTVAENVLKWGTGGINVDGCRVGFDMSDKNPATNPLYRHQNADKYKQVTDGGQKVGENVSFTNSMNPPSEEGRFPANIILECLCDEVIKGEKGEVIEHNGTGGIWNEGTKEPVGRTYNDKGDIHTNPMCPCRLMDEQSGMSKSSPRIAPKESIKDPSSYNTGVGGNSNLNDSGGASRFFYQAKVSKAERNMGLDDFDSKLQAGAEFRPNHMEKALKGEDGNPYGRYTPTKNNHPTVKPVSLMVYLCRLITPPNGIVLDPFMGSGSTGIAAQLEGFRFCGMEMDEDYFKIAKARIENFEEYSIFLKRK